MTTGGHYEEGEPTLGEGRNQVGRVVAIGSERQDPPQEGCSARC